MIGALHSIISEGLHRVAGVQAVATISRVAWVVVALLDAHKEPADAATECLDHVPKIDGVDEGFDAHWSSLGFASFVFARRLARGRISHRVKGLFGARDIGRIRESPEMENGKEGHLDAQ